MTKRVTEQHPDTGKVVTYKHTRALKKSEAKLIAWTPPPRTTAQKVARKLWG